MMFEIEILNDSGYEVDEALLREAAEAILNRHEVLEGSSLTIMIADDDTVANLNRNYRGVDSPTDVLSFPMDTMPSDIPYLGDLVIGYPYASAQAEREGHDLADSLMLLVVHGTLHLLGYDHDTPLRRAEMWEAQESALLKLGISPEIVPALENGFHNEPQE